MTITIADFPNAPIVMNISQRGESIFTDTETGQKYVIRFENGSGMRSEVQWRVNVHVEHHVLGYVVSILPYVPPSAQPKPRFQF
jgi:hypothetical protein